MTTLLEKSPLRLNNKRVQGRMSNVVADMLRKQLYVPNIFLDPKIPGQPSVDVLAVDRAGSGDTHAVEIKIFSIFPTRSQMRSLLAPLKALPFHFKYLALPGFAPDLSDSKKFADYTELFDESGIGRIGIISFDHKILQEPAAIDLNSVALTVRPERFRVRGEKLVAIEKFLAKTKPDMEVRI